MLTKGVDFEYIEQDPYNKSPEWLAINPVAWYLLLYIMANLSMKAMSVLSILMNPGLTNQDCYPKILIKEQKLAVKNHPSVKPVKQEESRVLADAKPYAEGNAKSELADAVRKGKTIP